ncbi:hypothetical protein B0T14DRAFT_493478 [Immersiella caudata]|uniref:Heterokaryon incompatibility domain-containing protein n=1 Tax=Immersiella caudata TaxID=314043 RepID=A0AA39X545_9PEZI|nr:hypothetical protein B0T14DRAFT_493478 [Immersiella caudata]
MGEVDSSLLGWVGQPRRVDDGARNGGVATKGPLGTEWTQKTAVSLHKPTTAHNNFGFICLRAWRWWDAELRHSNYHPSHHRKGRPAQLMESRNNAPELSSETVRMVQSEVNRCVETCNHHVLFRGFVPSRLLFVCDDGTSPSPPQLRLVSRGEVMASLSWASSVNNVLRYAALRYCWGSEDDAQQYWRTTRQVLAEYSTRGIDKEDLSPVDDDRDWRDEAALMGLVYSNAHVTIVNLDTDTCVEGFLAPWVAACQIWRTMRSPVSGMTSTMANVNEDKISYSYSDDFLWDWADSAWSNRGWTFQEEKLSTRLVYFGNSRIHFCCDNRLYTSGRSTRGKFERSIIELAMDKNTVNPARSLLKFWRSALVPQHSTKGFSVAGDKLPSIGGIAKLVGDMSGFGYAAGLWVPRLYIDLMWYCRPFLGHSTFEDLIQALVDGPRRADYITPSWSWARFPTTPCVEFWIGGLLAGNVVSQKQVLRTKVEMVEMPNSSPYRQIRGGVVTMVARTLDILPRDCRYQKPENGLGQNLFLTDWGTEFDGESDEGGEGDEVELALIQSYTATFGQFRKTDEMRYYGLMLYSAGIPGRYFRVGIFDVPEASEYSIAFKCAELREISLV